MEKLGKRKMNRWTRFLTVILSFLQSALFAKYALQMNLSRPGIVAGELFEIQRFGEFLGSSISSQFHHDDRNNVFDVGGRANY